MSYGFPVSATKTTYSVDTSAKKDEFFHLVKLSEKHWSQDNFEQSLTKLSNAIAIGKFIVANEPKGPLQATFTDKIKELMTRQAERTKQLTEGKPIQYTNHSGGGGGKAGGNKNDN